MQKLFSFRSEVHYPPPPPPPPRSPAKLCEHDLPACCVNVTATLSECLLALEKINATTAIQKFKG